MIALARPRLPVRSLVSVLLLVGATAACDDEATAPEPPPPEFEVRISGAAEADFASPGWFGNVQVSVNSVPDAPDLQRGWAIVADVDNSEVRGHLEILYGGGRAQPGEYPVVAVGEDGVLPDTGFVIGGELEIRETPLFLLLPTPASGTVEVVESTPDLVRGTFEVETSAVVENRLRDVVVEGSYRVR